MKYPVAEPALAKWIDTRLDLLEQSDGEVHYRFRYSGSTCNNGGAPFEAHLHIRVERPSQQVIGAWIEIPDSEKEGARKMCAAHGDGEALFQSLGEPAFFVGRTMEDVIGGDLSVNYAGCFCSSAMVNEKWLSALSTVHYAMNRP